MTLPAFPPGAALDALTGALCKGVRRFTTYPTAPPTERHTHGKRHHRHTHRLLIRYADDDQDES